jgi:hypothetical protein
LPPKGKEINHIDGVKRNNYWKNLEYLTNLENHQHAARIGLKPKGERSGMAKLTDTAVRFIRKNHKPYHPKFGVLPLSKRFGVHEGTVSSVLSGATWSHVV